MFSSLEDEKQQKYFESELCNVTNILLIVIKHYSLIIHQIKTQRIKAWLPGLN